MSPSETAERIIRASGDASWFAAVGEALTVAEIADAALYLAAIGRADIAVEGAATWTDAKSITGDPEWDRSWWHEEERIRTELTDLAAQVYSETAVHEALSRIATSTEPLQGAAAVAASRFGIADLGLIKSAAGAATQACHQAALARMAVTAEEHPFAVKFRLFEGGRWPLAILRGTYYIL